MKTHIAKQIASIVLDTLERNTKIALEAEPHYGGAALSKGTLEEMHKACANNLGQVIATALDIEVDL